MSSRNDKNKDVLKDLEKTISPVLVVNNSSLKPYVELFEYLPENIYQQPLGILVGFFEIKEYSEDSAYIVNFLTSVLKKEYYINPKRAVDESLDSALHKVNLALSELVKHGNIEWLGKLNAAICVLEKNNAHFSVAGNAKIFLYRNTVLTEVSEDLASDSAEPHPLKTFVNVSSGRLEKNDRLLITSEDIFHILPFSELKKNFQRFEGEKLVQFFKTALSNQIEMIASVVVEMTETIPVSAIKMTNSRQKIPKTMNVFSEKAFSEPAISSQSKVSSDKADLVEDEENPEYTDKKTGHIYVQGEANESEETTRMSLYWDILKEKIAQAWYASKSDIENRISLYKNKREKKLEIIRAEKEKQKQIALEEKKKRDELKAAKEAEKKQLEMERQKQMEAEKKERQEFLAKQKELEQKKLLEEQKELEQKEKELTEKREAEDRRLQEEKILETDASEENMASTVEKQPARSFKEKLEQAITAQKRQNESVINLCLQNEEERAIEAEGAGSEIEDKIAGFFKKHTNKEKTVGFGAESKEKILSSIGFFAQESYKKTYALLRNMLRSSYTATKSSAMKIFEKKEASENSPGIESASETKKESLFAPHFSKINKLFSSFTSAQKIYATLTLILIFVAPIFINRWMSRTKAEPITAIEKFSPSPSEVLVSEKNINLTPEKKNILSNNKIVATLISNSENVTITKNAVILVGNDGQQKEYPLPENSGTPLKTTFMKDLSLVFILTDANKIISFSPVSKKYTENNIVLPSNPDSLLIGTYLTYLYVLDPASNQIYRYPRATGGFGEKTNWLKESATLAQASDLTIDDNIYCIQNGKILKFFKGENQQFMLEASNTPVQFDRIFTTIDSQFLYVLDKENSRIITYHKSDGTIVSQYFDEELKNGTSIAVDEQNRKAYVSTLNQLTAYSL